MASHESSEVAETLKVLERDLFDAFEIPGDADRVDELYGEDFLSINADGSYSDKEDVLEIVENDLFPVSDRITNGETNVRSFGDTAIVSGRSQWYVDGAEVADVRHTHIWVRDDGDWRMVGWQGTPVNVGSGEVPEDPSTAGGS